MNEIQVRSVGHCRKERMKMSVRVKQKTKVEGNNFNSAVAESRLCLPTNEKLTRKPGARK